MAGRYPLGMREQLCNVLARYAGQTLTSEVAGAMVRELFPDRSIEPARFEPQRRGEYVIRAERFRCILGELKPLHEAHWLETERHRHGIELNPRYDAMAQRERDGNLLQFTARTQAGELVGHLRMFLFESQHTSTRVSEEDTLYVTPAHRGGFLAMHLMRYAEACLLQIGVKEIRANSKLVNRADVLMRRLGYDPVALQFCKIFN